MKCFWYGVIYAVPYIAVGVGLAIVCLYFGGRSEMIASLPMLGVAVLCGAAASALSLSSFRPPWLAARRNRTLRELQYALADYSITTEALQRTAIALSHLRSARAHAGDGALGDRIVLAIQRIEREQASIADEVGACIKLALPASRANRRPYLRTRGIPPAVVLWEGLALSALIVLFVKTQEPFEITKLVELPAQLFLVHALLRLVIRIELKRRAHRAHAGFRVLFVTDLHPLEPINRQASRAYSRVGELISIYSSDEDRRGIEPYIPGCGELYFVNRESVPGVVSAYLPNADLLVVNTRDESIARLLVEATSLPEHCRVSVDEDGFAPKGFLWMNPLRLALDPPGYTSEFDDPLDPATVFNLGIDWRGLGNGDYILGAGFVLGLALWCFEGWRPLGALLAAAGFAGEVPRLFGARRRANVSATVLRAPRSMTGSLRLRELKQIERRLSIALLLATATAAGYAAWSVIPRWGQPFWLLWISIGGIALVPVRFGLVEGLLRVMKWYCDWGFRVVVFRRNSVSFGHEHKLTVMGGCGAFGQVIVVQDKSIEQTDQNYGEWRESSLGAWFQVLTEAKDMLHPHQFLQSWKRQVVAELDRADFVVLDWAQEITPNMAWELRAAAARLPAHRILLVVGEERAAEAKALVDLISRKPDTESPSPLTPLIESRQPDDQYIWPSNREFKQRFWERLFEMMSRLQVEPRPTSDLPEDIMLETMPALESSPLAITT